MTPAHPPIRTGQCTAVSINCAPSPRAIMRSECTAQVPMWVTRLASGSINWSLVPSLVYGVGSCFSNNHILKGCDLHKSLTRPIIHRPHTTFLGYLLGSPQLNSFPLILCSQFHCLFLSPLTHSTHGLLFIIFLYFHFHHTYPSLIYNWPDPPHYNLERPGLQHPVHSSSFLPSASTLTFR